MFFIHQIVNVLINPIFDVLVLLAIGWGLGRRGRKRMGRSVCVFSVIALFFMSWQPFVDVIGIWLEKDYPAEKVDACPNADAIIVLGGGVGGMPPELDYPYPLMTDAADRVWHGVRLWRALKARDPEKVVKVYCTGPDVSLTMPSLLRDFGISEECIVAVDGPRNTEEEARTLGELFGRVEHVEGVELSTPTLEFHTTRPKALLVTSALHMKRATRIFKKYAPGLEVVPVATDHHFVADPLRFGRWHYWVPDLDALVGFSMIEHELVGLLRYAW